MHRPVGRNVARTAALVLALLLTDAAVAQVRSGLGGVRSAGPRMGGFSGRSAPRVSAPRFSGAARPNGSAFQPMGRTFLDRSAGLTVNGAFANDNFRLRFHLGTPSGLVCPPDHSHGDFCFKPDFCGTFPPLGFYPLYYYSSYDAGYPIDGYYSAIDPQLVGYTQPSNQQATPPPPPTDRELGDAALAWGEADHAVAAYRAHLRADPEDAEVIRLLGLALLDARDVKEGVAVFGMAYRKDPSLADRPLSERTLGPRPGALRDCLTRVAGYAERTGSASAWLTMAALAQAQGRRDVASRMVERARGAGLEQVVADRMVAALSSRRN